jgi:hypothetical protein
MAVILKRRKNKTRWDLLVNRGGKHICCVCRKRFKIGRRVFIGVHPQTQEELWRHDSCCANTYQWNKLFNKKDERS